MPFAGYQDFDACVSANSDKENPKGYCATIMRKVEEGHTTNMDPDLLNRIASRYISLKDRGIPDMEIQRVIMSEFAYGSHWSDPWPPQITGVDIVDNIYPNLVPAQSYPPYEGITDTGKLTGMDLQIPDRLEMDQIALPQMLAGPPEINNEPAMNQRQIPEEAWYPWGDNIREASNVKYARYKYNGHEMSEFCKTFNGGVFDLNQRSGRPVLPMEGLGYTSQHPNCACTWELIDPILSEDVEPTDMIDAQKQHIATINRLIGQKARYGTLHLLDLEGKVIDGLTNINPRTLMETVGELHKQFQWMTPEYTQGLKSKNLQGRVYLIRAAAETTTDHRVEGDPYQRKLDGLELFAMARTAIGKGMDINHNDMWRTNSIVLDSEGDIDRKEIQMIVLERDPEIIEGIARGDIDAVSINGGVPRTQPILPCEDGSEELCLHPRGVVLGEGSGIALTWVVTNPKGFMWRGRKIPPAEPGIKNTSIQPLS